MSKKEIVVALDQLLKPLGFIRKSNTWNREIASFVDVLDIQINSGIDAVTVNAGVIERSVYADCWGDDPGKLVEEPRCTVRSRIGMLIDHKDKWWSIDDANAPSMIVSCVVEYVFPFYEKLRSLEGLHNWLARTNGVVKKFQYPPPVIYLAILKFRLGDQCAACSILNDLYSKTNETWQASVNEVAKRLGCVLA